MTLMGWFLWWYVSREVREYLTYRADRETSIQHADTCERLCEDSNDQGDESEPTPPPTCPPEPRDPSAEPAYQFPGIPSGWSLDRYTRDGLQQLTVHLVQSARRKP